jgi:hypothetical protein
MPLIETIAALWPFQGTSVRPQVPRTAIAWCPRCRRDLNGDDESFAGDRDVIHYRCATCGCLSWWDFDAPCPILLGSSHAPTVPAAAQRTASS